MICRIPALTRNSSQFRVVCNVKVAGESSKPSLGVYLFVSVFWFFALQPTFGQSTNSVQLLWDPSPATDIVAYRIYYGVASQSYSHVVTVGNVTNAVIEGLAAGTVYYFAATAVDTQGVESVFSNEISYSVPATSPSPLPAVVLTSPGDFSGYLAPATINLTASVVTNGHSITGVQFYSGSTLLGHDAANPNTFTWNSVSAGSYSLTAIVSYDGGGTVSSPIVHVGVTNPPPAVALTSPGNLAKYAAPATINLAAAVVANGHTVQAVQFYSGGSLLGQDTGSPYTFTWANVSAGSYVLSAKVMYDGGSSVTTPGVSVSVTNPVLPVVTLLSPADGATYTQPATIPLAASVVANGHAISQIRFLNGSTLLASDNSPPYSFTWTNPTVGTYKITASVVYDSGSTVVSAPSTISVNSLPPPWQSVDLGNVGLSGSAIASSTGCTVRGAGNLSGLADNFRFLYQPGDTYSGIRAQISSVSNSGPNGIVGLMVRETLTPGSEYVLMGMASDGTFRFQYRTNTANSTVAISGGPAKVPNSWALIQRYGTAFYAFSSVDGTNWTYVNSATFNMATNVYLGFAAASGVTNALNTTVFTNFTIRP